MADQIHSTQDLRSDANDSKRFHDNQAKWALGIRLPNDRCPERAVRPRRHRRSRTVHENLYALSKARSCRGSGSGFSVVDDDINSYDGEPSDAVLGEPPDCGITYTFDRPTGPSNGNHLLGQALAMAVERYETVKTEKLVNDEYEVLDSDGEPVADRACSLPKTAVRGPFNLDEDDYELV